MPTSLTSLTKEIFLRTGWFIVSALVPTVAFIWHIVTGELAPEWQSSLRYMGFERRTFYEIVGALTALCVIGVTVRNAFAAIRKREQAQDHVRRLGLLLSTAHKLLDRCANIRSDLPVEEIEAWTMGVQSLLQDLGGKYLDGYTNPLRRPKPIDVIETEGTIQMIIPSRLHYDQWKLLLRRIEHLEQVMADLSSR